MGGRRARYSPDRDVAPWEGATRPYDIAKELVVCFLVVAVLTRPNGILMVPGFAIALLVQAGRDRRRLTNALLTAGVVGAIVLKNRTSRS